MWQKVTMWMKIVVRYVQKKIYVSSLDILVPCLSFDKFLFSSSQGT
jgi:hypothetical protein